MYVKHFGPDYEPDDYIKEAYKPPGITNGT